MCGPATRNWFEYCLCKGIVLHFNLTKHLLHVRCSDLCALWDLHTPISSDLGALMLFGKDQPQNEGRHHAHQRIKSPPAAASIEFFAHELASSLLDTAVPMP